MCAHAAQVGGAVHGVGGEDQALQFGLGPGLA
jgi:hypothetical protein